MAFRRFRRRPLRARMQMGRRTGYIRRRGMARRGSEFRLVIQAPRGVLPAYAAPYRFLRRRYSRRF